MVHNCLCSQQGDDRPGSSIHILLFKEGKKERKGKIDHGKWWALSALPDILPLVLI